VIPAPRAMPQPIRRRVLLSLVVGVGLLALLGVASITMISSAHRSLEAQVGTLVGLMDNRRFLIQAVSLQETTVLDYQLTHVDRAVEEFMQAGRDAAVAEARLEDLAADDPALLAIVENVVLLAGAWRDEWAYPLVELLETGATVPATGALSNEQGELLFMDVEVAFERLDESIQQRGIANAAQQQVATNRLEIMIAGGSVAFGVCVLLLGAWLLRTVTGPLSRLSQTAASLVAGQPVTFQAEREDEIGTLAEVLERLRVDVDGRYATARSDAERSATYNKLGDLISFSATEDELVQAAVKAIRRLTGVTHGDVQLANASQNRLIVAGTWGDGGLTTGHVVALDRIDRCPGIRRASAFLMRDVSDDLAVRCPAHPTPAGAVACVPMMALGQVVGVIHLDAPEGHLDAEDVAVVARVAEQIAIALANTRLMRTLEGLAMTDSLTGLHNARFFDSFLEQQLAAAERDDAPLALIMMDIDHFKKFNDTHGHPAGDEALRAFGRVVKSVMRASDVVARYGGEEFIVALPGSTQEEARRVAEKLRQAVEEMVVEIGPGRHARATISLGVVGTDQKHLDQKGLVAMADAALYRAKEGGRNQVATAPESERRTTVTTRRRREGTPSEAPIELPTVKSRPA
jgi:diguanylate cyclase (GGDEF)-like protein